MCDPNLVVFEKCREICLTCGLEYRLEDYDVFIEIPNIGIKSYNNVDDLYHYLLGFRDGCNYAR